MMKWTLLQMSGGCISVLKANWMLIELITTGDMYSTPKAQLVKKNFPVLEKAIKALLLLPHGNSDVEREFSTNKEILGNNRHSLDMPCLNGERLCREVVRLHQGKPEKVPLTKNSLIQAASRAWKAYEIRLAEKKQEQEKATE